MFLLYTPVSQCTQIIVVAPGGKYRGNLLQVIKHGRIVDITGMQDKIYTMKCSGYFRRESFLNVRNMCICQQTDSHFSPIIIKAVLTRQRLPLAKSDICGVILIGIEIKILVEHVL
jgi:hypothetical protein